MDSHPKYISMACIYVACKTEKVNIPITQIARNINWTNNNIGLDIPKITEMLTHYETPLMETIDFNLIIRDLFDAAENLIKHINCYKQIDFDSKRKDMENFIYESLLTDIILLYGPSHISLAAILHVAGTDKNELVDYLCKMLNPNTELAVSPGIIKHIRKSVRDRGLQQGITNVDNIEQKLTLCRNEDNNLFPIEIPSENSSGSNSNRRKTLQCNECYKSFSTQNGLRYHIESHLQLKPFKCNIYFKSFGQKSTLTRHQATTHAKIKAHVCPICKKCFSSRSELQRHRERHEAKRNICPSCSKTFIDKRYFKSHVRICTAQRITTEPEGGGTPVCALFQCPACEKSYHHPNYFKKHIRLCSI